MKIKSKCPHCRKSLDKVLNVEFTKGGADAKHSHEVRLYSCPHCDTLLGLEPKQMELKLGVDELKAYLFFLAHDTLANIEARLDLIQNPSGKPNPEFSKKLAEISSLKGSKTVESLDEFALLALMSKHKKT